MVSFTRSGASYHELSVVISAFARVTVVVLFVCVSVPALAILQRPLISATNDAHWFLLGVSWILTRRFSKKPSVQKLWREKANMQIS